MAAFLKEMCPLEILVLYENDGLFSKYSDGTTLQLSPCGAAFLHRETPPNLCEVQRLTRFATSSFKRKIVQSIQIRNLFAARPYLCKELTNPQELQVGYQGVSKCAWAEKATADSITQLEDGSVCVTSLDGFASLTLMPHRQAFTVKFLVEVKSSLPKGKSIHPRKPVMDSSGENETKNHESKEHKCFVVWLEQIHSLSFYPEAWNHPLQLVLQAAYLDKSTSLDNMITLPDSLPITCAASHLHKWKTQVSRDTSSVDWEVFWQPNIKVIWKDGVVYRIFRQLSGSFTVEIYPGDGSVLRSHGSVGEFFSHWFVQGNNGTKNFKIEERVYTTRKLPPDQLLTQELGYSVGRLIKQAARYKEFVSKTPQIREEMCCWIEASKSKAIISIPSYPVQLIETADVPGTGRFRAYSNGHVNVVFADRTILDMRNYFDSKGDNTVRYQFILPNGEVLELDVMAAHENVSYFSYIQLAHHWAEWVKATPLKRTTFYKDTIWDTEKRRTVTAEMEKLRRFHYISDQENLKPYGGTAATTMGVQADKCYKECGMLQDRQHIMIQGVLQQTTKAIGDIDGLLSRIKCQFK